MKIIATIPPYAPFIPAVAAHPLVSGVRLNTVMPMKGSLADNLARLKKLMGGKDVWVDLKCRQLRIARGFTFKEPEGVRTYEIHGRTVVLDPGSPRHHGELRTPPWAEIILDHRITLDLSKGPVKCWLQDGYDSAMIAEVEGNRLIMLDGPQRIVGGGESINILDPSLVIEGFFTDQDLEYIEAAQSVGIHTFMLSYVESTDDIEAMKKLDPEAVIVAKIESQKGVDWAREWYELSDDVRLMAARGDLYVELGSSRPERILPALSMLPHRDPRAILASRILTSLRNGSRPTCADITDIECMIHMGYKHFMLGDDICMKEGSLMLALDICGAIA